MDKYRKTKEHLLAEWGRYLISAAHQGVFTNTRPLPLRAQGIAGPRAGALELSAGVEAAKLIAHLRKNDAALLRQFVPWDFTGEPVAFMRGRFVRVEAGWSPEMAEKMVRLDSLCRKPALGGRWVVGKSEMGATVIASLGDKTPHYLLAGTTGSGKSVALRAAVLQLSRDPENRIVLVDGKMGEGLGMLAHLPGVVGPVATDGPSARSALTWACVQMREQYETATLRSLQAEGNGQGRIVVVIDEFQEWAGDKPFVGLLRKLAAQGRAAHVHLLAATQHPTVDAFGDASTRRNLAGKLALRVGDPDASRVAVGGKLPRADYLLGAGDAYAVGPGTCHRVQGAYVDQADVQTVGEWEFDEWDVGADEVGQELPGGRAITGEELGAALLAASQDEGRVKFQRRLEEAQLAPGGNNRAMRILNLARQQLEWLRAQRYEVRATCDGVRPSGSAPSHPSGRVISSVKW